MHASHKTRRIQGENRKFTLWGLVRSFGWFPPHVYFAHPLSIRSLEVARILPPVRNKVRPRPIRALWRLRMPIEIFSPFFSAKTKNLKHRKVALATFIMTQQWRYLLSSRQSEDRCSQAFNGGLRRGRGWGESARYRKARQWSTISRRKWAIPVKENIRKCKCKLVYSGRASQFTGSLL